MAPNEKRKNDRLAVVGVITVLLIVAWWMCWIIVPAFPNGKCAYSGGTQTGLSGGGLTCPADNPSAPAGSDGGCPRCDYPRCDPPTVYNSTSGRCENCPEGFFYDTGTGVCSPDTVPLVPDTNLDDCCPEGYYWDQKYQQCFYSSESEWQILSSVPATASLCESKLHEADTAQLIAGGVCPDHSYFDTYYYKCFCYAGFYMDYETGCCERGDIA